MVAPETAVVAPEAAFRPIATSPALLATAFGPTATESAPSAWESASAEFTTAQGKEAARSVASDLLGTLNGALGDLGKIKRIAKIMVLVNSTETFTEQHLVANGASELFGEVFGEIGAHARSAFGVAQIPFGACLEIELIAEV